VAQPTRPTTPIKTGRPTIGGLRLLTRLLPSVEILKPCAALTWGLGVWVCSDGCVH
jgi:hypothetical protein